MNEDIKSLIIRFADTALDRATLMIDANYTIVYANAFVLTGLNLTADKVIGKSLLHDFYGGRKFHPDGSYVSLLIKAVDTGEDITSAVITPDILNMLPPNHYRSRVMVAKDAAGRVKHAISVSYVIDREKELEARLGSIEFQIIKSLIKALDARDNPTGCHSMTVAKLAEKFAAQLGLYKNEENKLYLAGLVHDIGKIGVPEAILNKPGKLTSVEYELIKKHSVIGFNILKEIESLSSIALAVRHHHERYDGTGYPDGLSGQAIPFHSRLISLCDAFEAMTAPRVYKSPLPLSLASSEIKRQRGKQFDPELADEFIALFCADTG